MINAREIALNILYDIEYNGAYSNIAIKNAFKKYKELTPLDKAFVTRLVYGVVSMKLNLEYIIEQFSNIKPKKISKYIYIILKMCIYQLLYMDKIPQSAAVNEGVKLAKRYGHIKSSGFVNALLHSVIKKEIIYPENNFENLSVRYSYPLFLVKKWCNEFGEGFTKDLLIAMNEESYTTLRVNTLKADTDDIINQNSNFSKTLLHKNAVIAKGLDVGNSKLYQEGKIIAQDISAMMTALVLNPKKDELVLDMCAAPGGKTTHMAELMKNKGKIIACDIYEHKVELIKENSKRMGIDIIDARKIDATEYNEEFFEKFDKILADVPCSGYGIVSKKPDIKWKAPENTELLTISKEILTNASKYVKIGGEIVFSTCTINKEENEDRLFEFLNENENFSLVDISEFLPKELRHKTCKDGYVTFYPNIDNIDGFFVAKVKRCK